MSRRVRYSLVAALLLACAGGAYFCTRVELAFSADWEGLYLLGGSADRLVVSNTLYLGDETRYRGGIDFIQPVRVSGEVAAEPRLELDWNEAAGVGLLRNELGDGTVLVTNFSRYTDSYGKRTRGLFIGGALPASVRRESTAHLNDSGMTWFDGREWNHIWCNTNEGIISAFSRESAAPSQWTYLGSRVLEQSSERVVISSRHEVTLNTQPFLIERIMEANAGIPYLQLEIRITNTGSQPSGYSYYYGDEPWLGDFGSSAGDIGWLPDRLVATEEYVDPRRYSFAGMVDDGNDLLPEGHNYRHVANFIDWAGPDRPDTVFFANRYFGIDHDPATRQVPLFSNARSLGMLWQRRILAPGESRVISLAIGMAQRTPLAAVPRIPPIKRTPHLASLTAPPLPPSL